MALMKIYANLPGTCFSLTCLAQPPDVLRSVRAVHGHTAAENFSFHQDRHEVHGSFAVSLERSRMNQEFFNEFSDSLYFN